MSVPQPSFSDIDIIPGRAPEVSETDTTALFTKLKEEFPEDARFLASHIGFDDDELDWEGARPLGKGSFGRVGLWVARDKEGSYVKEIAVKQCDQKEGAPMNFREASIMKQLNQFQCPNILRLENFKYYPAARKYRYYLEFCPFADVEDLWRRYREKGDHLPEQLIWHVFHGLARAAQVMARGPFNDLNTHKPTTDRLLHLDIKPANVMLGHKADESLFQSYPVVKLGDFGVSRLVDPEDPRNPTWFYRIGSSAYRPPEHRPFWDRGDRLTGQQTKIEKFRGWADPPVTAGVTKLEPRSNIWPIGLVIYMLITLHSVRKWLKLADVVEEEDFIALGNHVIGPIETRKQPEYSEELRNLVRDCLNPRIESRPTASSLVSRTEAGMERFRTSRNGRNTTRAPALHHLTKSTSVLPEGRAPQMHRAPAGAAGPASVPSPGDGDDEEADEDVAEGAGQGVNEGLGDGAAEDPPSIRTGVNPLNHPWEPRRGTKRQRPSGQRERRIIRSSDEDFLGPELPPNIKNERDGKRQRISTDEQSVQGKSKIITNIAGEVITISSSTSSANAPTADKDQDHHNAVHENAVAEEVIVISSDTPSANASATNKDQEHPRVPHQDADNGGSSSSHSNRRSGSKRSGSLIAQQGSNTGDAYSSFDEEEESDKQGDEEAEDEDNDGIADDEDEDEENEGYEDEEDGGYEDRWGKYDDEKDGDYEDEGDDGDDEDYDSRGDRRRPRLSRRRAGPRSRVANIGNEADDTSSPSFDDEEDDRERRSEAPSGDD